MRVRHVLDNDWLGAVTDTNGKHKGWLKVKWDSGEHQWHPPGHVEPLDDNPPSDPVGVSP